MTKEERLRIIREANRLLDLDLSSDNKGFSLETLSKLHVLHEQYIQDMGEDYIKHHNNTDERNIRLMKYIEEMS